MPKKEIVPRKVLNHGQERWRVIVPKDMRQAEGKVFHFFTDEKEAKKKAAELSRDRGHIAEGFHALSQKDQALVLEALHRAGSARRLLAAADKLDEVEQRSEPRPVMDVVTDYLKKKQEAGVKHQSYKNVKSSLTKFAVGVGVQTIGGVTTELIEQWLNSNGWGVNSRRTYVNHLRGLLLYATERGFISKNPASIIPYPKYRDRLPPIHTVEQVKQFLALTLKRDPALLGYICPIYFGGLRPDESKGLRKEDIKDNVIVVNAHIAKLGKRRFVPIDPLLKAWLAVPGVKIGNRNIRRRLHYLRDSFEEHQRMKKKFGPAFMVTVYKYVNGKKTHAFPWCQDIMRHTYCSYAVPKLGKVEVANRAANSEDILDRHYVQRVEPEDVEKFWALTPEAVLQSY